MGLIGAITRNYRDLPHPHPDPPLEGEGDNQTICRAFCKKFVIPEWFYRESMFLKL